MIETLTLALSAVVALGTMLLGIPAATALAAPGALRRTAPPTTSERAAQVARPGFTPLDLGPDKLTWPSLTPWRNPPSPSADWPSEGWDDPQLGLAARRRKRPDPAPAPAPQRAPTVPDVVEHVQAAAVQLRGAPDPDAVLRRVEQIGIAKAIEELMSETGWDMPAAVSWLREARRRQLGLPPAE